MRRVLLGLCLALLSAGTVLGQEPVAGVAGPGGGYVDNLFIEAGAGAMMPADEDSTALAYGAVNYGFPIVDEWNLGVEAGGKLTLRDNDPDWLASLGIFQRQFLGYNAAWSVQAVYQNTWDHADLMSLKPVAGMALDDMNYLALTGVIGLNEEHVERGIEPVTQQPLDQAMLLWGATWTDAIRTEVGAGYAFGEVDAMTLGVHAGYQLTSMVSVNLTGQADFEGNYYAALALGFDLGETSANATFNNVTGTGYTPFPLGSLPVVFYENQDRDVQGGVLPPPPPEED